MAAAPDPFCTITWKKNLLASIEERYDTEALANEKSLGVVGSKKGTVVDVTRYLTAGEENIYKQRVEKAAIDLMLRDMLKGIPEVDENNVDIIVNSISEQFVEFTVIDRNVKNNRHNFTQAIDHKVLDKKYAEIVNDVALLETLLQPSPKVTPSHSLLSLFSSDCGGPSCRLSNFGESTVKYLKEATPFDSLKLRYNLKEVFSQRMINGKPTLTDEELVGLEDAVEESLNSKTFYGPLIPENLEKYKGNKIGPIVSGQAAIERYALILEGMRNAAEETVTSPEMRVYLEGMVEGLRVESRDKKFTMSVRHYSQLLPEKAIKLFYQISTNSTKEWGARTPYQRSPRLQKLLRL